MKTTLIVAAALAASVNGAVIEGRQRVRSSTRPASPGGIPDGKHTPAKPTPVERRDPQISIGPPRPSFTFWPNDPPGDRVSECGLDAFIGHTSEALLFCSSILKGGTQTLTSTYTTRETTTVKTTVVTTLYPPTQSPTARPSSTVRLPTSTPKPPTSAPPTSTPRPPTPTTTVKPPTSTPAVPSTTAAPQPGTSCGIVGYTKNIAAYYFDSSGTQNTWAACGAKCKADSKCKSFGYGEANCMLFDVTAAENTNYNPMSPYTFYDQSCPEELPVKKKRQINISLGLPGGAGGVSSACSCLITAGPGATTKTTTVTVTSVRVTSTQTVTRTVSLLPDDSP